MLDAMARTTADLQDDGEDMEFTFGKASLEKFRKEGLEL